MTVPDTEQIVALGLTLWLAEQELELSTGDREQSIVVVHVAGVRLR